MSVEYGYIRNRGDLFHGLFFFFLTSALFLSSFYVLHITPTRRIFIMGGTICARGNASPLAEFNVHCDPEAFSIVLKASRDLFLERRKQKKQETALESATPTSVTSSPTTDSAGSEIEHLVLLVSSEKIGLVIGRGGETIRSIQMKHTAKILISSSESPASQKREVECHVATSEVPSLLESFRSIAGEVEIVKGPSGVKETPSTDEKESEDESPRIVIVPWEVTEKVGARVSFAS